MHNRFQHPVNPLHILVTGGGSAGHISPALAVIQSLKQCNVPEPEFLYLGGRNGPEGEECRRLRIPFVGIETGKLRRYFSWKNFTDVLRFPLGIAQSVRAMRRFRPDVVFSTGGYVSVPPVLAACLLRVPVVIHEQTVQVGLANRIAAFCATKIALSWDSAMEDLSKPLRKKAFLVGNPVRSAVFGGSRDAANRLFEFDVADADLPHLYVTGGSQGARVINRAIEAALPELLKHCLVIHQCGRQPEGTEQDFDRLEAARQNLPLELARRYRVTPFVRGEINHVFEWCDLVLSRAGASTVSELCVLGKPAVYVPLVPTGGDEQTRNAQMCERAGAARLIHQSQISAERLVAELPTLLNDKTTLQQMSAAALRLSKPGAAKVLAEVVAGLGRHHGKK